MIAVDDKETPFEDDGPVGDTGGSSSDGPGQRDDIPTDVRLVHSLSDGNDGYEDDDEEGDGSLITVNNTGQQSRSRSNTKSVQFSKQLHSFDNSNSTTGSETGTGPGGGGSAAGVLRPSTRSSAPTAAAAQAVDDPNASTRSQQSVTSVKSYSGGSTTGGIGSSIRQNSHGRHSMARGKSSRAMNVTDSFKRQMEDVRKQKKAIVFLPWSKYYRMWFVVTVAFSLLTVFVETYAIAFNPGGGQPPGDPSSIIEYCFMSIFVMDIIITCNLAYQDENDILILDRKKIARHYLSFWFWVDLIGVFPFYIVILAIMGDIGVDDQTTRYLQLVRLFRLVRLYRIMSCFEMLQYSSRISLLWLTLIRDFGAALMWTHFAACAMFFISRQSNFEDSWLSTPSPSETNADLYLTSLYWSIVTFATVGYGDYSPVNAAEQIFAMIYMFLNMVIASWIIGSITLLVVKNDEKNGQYRDDLKLLEEYSHMNNFGHALKKRLKTQLKLDFNNREISDENVLQNFPRSLRRKVLRKLYYPLLQETSLMHDVKQSFVDQFLNSCSVELFGPGEEILQRGSLSNDLYLLVEGVVQASSSADASTDDLDTDRTSLIGGGSIADSDYRDSNRNVTWTQICSGDFINAIPFFTEAPNIETVKTSSICKMLSMPHDVFKSLSDENPGCASTILENLLQKVKQMIPENVNVPQRLEALRIGSAFDIGGHEMSPDSEFHQTILHAQAQAALTTVEDLIQMHINKQKDDNTTRFLFAASRSDLPTLRLMLNSGLDPNAADYDRRNALMVAAMNGNSEVVTLLLDYHANPNLVDVHGTSALYEAVKGAHDDTIDILLKHGGTLCMPEETAATTLCQCVFNGDLLFLKRLCKAGIDINAGDYDRRRAVHIAASEGNLAAVRVLAECGADLTVLDRWENSIEDEAKRANAVRLLVYLESLKTSKSS